MQRKCPSLSTEVPASLLTSLLAPTSAGVSVISAASSLEKSRSAETAMGARQDTAELGGALEKSKSDKNVTTLRFLWQHKIGYDFLIC
ncbi:hypothetical protein EBO34_00645 [Alteribacter keqinensis]|uniref:Uncharacterized protein n=1 Tax=Alteribacter keqinensis TaxID=2483800 RepID=A0A3M7TVU7_9BACI|nr:hypothetical protein EBO34_00645 [Alteribacter keqinensis]